MDKLLDSENEPVSLANGRPFKVIIIGPCDVGKTHLLQ